MKFSAGTILISKLLKPSQRKSTLNLSQYGRYCICKGKTDFTTDLNVVCEILLHKQICYL